MVRLKCMVTIPAKVGGNHNSIPNTRSSQAVSQFMKKPMSHGFQRQNNEKRAHENSIGWLNRKKTKHIYIERFRYGMKNPSCKLGMVFNNNSLCLIKCNWVLKHGTGVTIWNVDLFFHICYTVKYSKEKWKLNLDIWGESGWQAGITLLKGMHLKSLTAKDLGLKTLITAQLYPFKQRNHVTKLFMCIKYVHW